MRKSYRPVLTPIMRLLEVGRDITGRLARIQLVLLPETRHRHAEHLLSATMSIISHEDYSAIAYAQCRRENWLSDHRPQHAANGLGAVTIDRAIPF